MQGPDFNTSELLSRSQIRSQLGAENGDMPSYRGRLTPRQKAAVTEFVFATLHQR